MEKGKELECTRRAGGGKGSGIREADSDDRGFPLLLTALANFSTRKNKFALNVNRKKKVKSR